VEEKTEIVQHISKNSVSIFFDSIHEMRWSSLSTITHLTYSKQINRLPQMSKHFIRIKSITQCLKHCIITGSIKIDISPYPKMKVQTTNSNIKVQMFPAKFNGVLRLIMYMALLSSNSYRQRKLQTKHKEWKNTSLLYLLSHGFSNCGKRNTTGKPTTVY